MIDTLGFVLLGLVALWFSIQLAGLRGANPRMDPPPADPPAKSAPSDTGKTSLRLALFLCSLVAIGLCASSSSATNLTPVTGSVACAGSATQLPNLGPKPLIEWSLFNGSAKAVWLGTSSSVNTTSSWGWIASNGGVFTSHLSNTNKVWCISASGTNTLNIWGER